MGICTNILNILLDRNVEAAAMKYKPELPEIRITDERIRHMHGVAELMYQYADAFNCKYLSKDELYLLGLCHDIGYIHGKQDHEHNGSEIFEGLDYNEGKLSVISQCIYYHGTTPKEYMDCNQCSASDIPKELILLWWADMCVESGGEHAGEIVGFQGRLDSLEKRYGEVSKPYLTCKETIEWLINYVSQNYLTKPID